MARPLRIQYEGAHHHIFAKGNRDEYIFAGERDKDRFVELLAQGQEEYDVEIYAYCVLGNHYHLLIQTHKTNLPSFMHYLGSSYGSYLSKKEWKGHVFSGRYKSICVDREEYLMILSRYIHLNPVAANIAKLPEDYQWSSYPYYIDGAKPPRWLNTGWLVDYFGPGIEGASRRYREFVMSGIGEENLYPSKQVIGQAILGGREFAERIIARVNDQSIAEELWGRKESLRKFTLEEAYDAVQELHGLNTFSRSTLMEDKELLRARRAFIFLAKEYTAATNREISEMIGDVKPVTVATQHNKICNRYQADGEYREALSAEVRRLLDLLQKNGSTDG